MLLGLVICRDQATNIQDEEALQHLSNHFAEFENDADIIGTMSHVTRIASALKQQNSSYHPIVLSVGVNEGKLLDKMLLAYPTLTIHGFEIDGRLVKRVNKRLRTIKHLTNTTVYHIGMSNVTLDIGMPVAGHGQTAGLYSEDIAVSKFRNMGWKSRVWTRHGYEEVVPVTSLYNWTMKNNIRRVSYTTVDVEGHEAKVIQGMHLASVENRRRFPAFQFELGGTWGPDDPRRDTGELTQFQIATMLAEFGYQLYLIGKRSYIHVTPEFFQPVLHPKHGGLVWSNCLAVHDEFVDPMITQMVRQHLLQ